MEENGRSRPQHPEARDSHQDIVTGVRKETYSCKAGLLGSGGKERRGQDDGASSR
jgi:hypothetical protein